MQGRVVLAWLANLCVSKLNAGSYGPEDDFVFVARAVYPDKYSS